MSRRCEVHNVEHREEVHPLAATNPAFRGRTHLYCPECRAEAQKNVQATAHLTDAELRHEARQQLRDSIRPTMRVKPGANVPGGSWVQRNGVLVPRANAEPAEAFDALDEPQPLELEGRVLESD